MAEICDLSDLPIDQCACRVHKPQIREDWGTGGITIPAKFAAVIACGHWVQVGDTITLTDDGWICAECAL